MAAHQVQKAKVMSADPENPPVLVGVDGSESALAAVRFAAAAAAHRCTSSTRFPRPPISDRASHSSRSTSTVTARRQPRRSRPRGKPPRQRPPRSANSASPPNWPKHHRSPSYATDPRTRGCSWSAPMDWASSAALPLRLARRDAAGGGGIALREPGRVRRAISAELIASSTRSSRAGRTHPARAGLIPRGQDSSRAGRNRVHQPDRVAGRRPCGPFRAHLDRGNPFNSGSRWQPVA